MLESCLRPSPDLGVLQNPLAGLVFHYDQASAGTEGLPCEAAYLCSLGIKTQVLVSISNYPIMKELYRKLNPEIEVRAIKIDEQHLNINVMQTLMADTGDGPTPLYLHNVHKILRKLNWDNYGGSINYEEFTKMCLREIKNPMQLGPLLMRLDLVEEFVRDPRHPYTKQKYPIEMADDWAPKPGQLTIVDLSDPQINTETACSLFEICLEIFQKQRLDVGKVIVMDEAHKYMNDGASAARLTEALKTAIRMQRHRAARIIIATQEPTISEALLDLCSITLIHRFSSPAWYTIPKGHLAAIANDGDEPDSSNAEGQREVKNNKKRPDRLFLKIAGLNAGEALLCAPSAMIGVVEDEDGNKRPQKLGTNYVKVRIRERLSKDGGRSLMANRGSVGK